MDMIHSMPPLFHLILYPPPFLFRYLNPKEGRTLWGLAP